MAWSQRHWLFLRVLPLLLAVTSAGCEGNTVGDAELGRTWGHDLIQARINTRASDPIDARSLGDTPELARRVFDMPFKEVAARLNGFQYVGTSQFTIRQGERRTEVFEDTLIVPAPNGWRVVQKNRDGDIVREHTLINHTHHVRNGTGQLRTNQAADIPGTRALKEAFSPLSTFTSWYGPRIGLVLARSRRLFGKTTVGYRLQLLTGPDLIDVPALNRRFRPKLLSGKLILDAETSAPLKARISGAFDIEPVESLNPKSSKDRPWGQLEFELTFEFKPSEEGLLTIEDAIAPISRRTVDLDPLGFLTRETQTSTVIGGPRRKRSQP